LQDRLSIRHEITKRTAIVNKKVEKIRPEKLINMTSLL